MDKIKYIAIKEVRHILRDPVSLAIAILMPIIMTFLYGYAINMDMKNITLATIDLDNSIESRELIGKFYNSNYFLKSHSQPSLSDPEKVLRSGDANMILTIRSGFSEAFEKIEKFELGLLVDGSDANMSSAGINYANMIISQFMKERLLQGRDIPGVVISPKILFNSDLKSSHHFVPGLIAVILVLISALLTSVTIAREKETGTMEQLLTTPVTPQQVIIGKVAPYIGLAFLDALLVIAFALVIFGVPFKGSAILLFCFGLIYVTTALSFGILISTIVPTQQLAMMAAQLLTILPSVMLSGYIFEIKNMPKFLQMVSLLIPARYFIVVLRGIMLKGSDLNVLWKEAIILIVISAFFLFLASKRFKLKIG